jgi:hypothetical protein
MADARSGTQLRSDFDDFLLSPIGDGSNGMPVTMLSALARAKPDPWWEAAELARMPRDIAIQRLSQFIGTIQGVALGEANSDSIATRLVVLLPRLQIFESPISNKIFARRFPQHPRLTPTNIVFAILIAMLVVAYIARYVA